METRPYTYPEGHPKAGMKTEITAEVWQCRHCSYTTNMMDDIDEHTSSHMSIRDEVTSILARENAVLDPSDAKELAETLLIQLADRGYIIASTVMMATAHTEKEDAIDHIGSLLHSIEESGDHEHVSYVKAMSFWKERRKLDGDEDV